MAETDFNDLLTAVEQLASEIDETGELTRVERTPRQVLEASQELWARVSATGAQEIKANLLLGSKGVDLPQLSQKLESLNTKSTFEPAEAIPDTDIESFLRNETDNAILSIFESSHAESLETWEKDYKASIVYSWEAEKLKLMSSMLGRSGKDFLAIPLAQERSVLNESIMETNIALKPDEVKYAQALMEYNQSIVEGKTPNLIEKFAHAMLQCNDQMVNNLWTIVKYMTQIPPQKKKDPIEARSVPAVKIKMISQARNYLENRYRLYMNTVVHNSMRYTQYDKEPGTYTLVRSFVGVRVPREYLGLDSIQLDGLPLWALVYYCLRCGDIQSALRCVQKAGQGFEEVCKALEELKGSIMRRVSPKLEKLIRTHYRRSVRSDTDPYKRVVFCILGGCDISDEHSELTKTADDYLWLKLNQIHEEEESKGSESLTLSLLQRLIIEEYGERHYNASEQPHVYFQLLFLTGQWEAAIDFLIRNDKLQVHGVHLAIVLHELHLLASPVDVKAPLFVVDRKDPKPMHRINFARLIQFYVHKFENQHLLEALHYYFCLRALKTTVGGNVFAECVSGLLISSREYEIILGHLDSDNCHIPGLIDRFKATKEHFDRLINQVAKTLERTGQYEDAVKVHDLAGNHEDVLRLMSIMLSQEIARVGNEPGSLRTRLAVYAESIVNRYSGIEVKCEQETQVVFFKLCELMKFFNYYNQKQFPEALDTIQRFSLIPMSLDEVDVKLRNLQTMGGAICRNIPEVLLATMDILHTQYSKIKLELQNTRSYYGDSPQEQLQSLRQRAEALTTFAGSIPYKLPGDTGSKLVQMEIRMD